MLSEQRAVNRVHLVWHKEILKNKVKFKIEFPHKVDYVVEAVESLADVLGALEYFKFYNYVGKSDYSPNILLYQRV